MPDVIELQNRLSKAQYYAAQQDYKNYLFESLMSDCDANLDELLCLYNTIYALTDQLNAQDYGDVTLKLYNKLLDLTGLEDYSLTVDAKFEHLGITKIFVVNGLNITGPIEPLKFLRGNAAGTALEFYSIQPQGGTSGSYQLWNAIAAANNQYDFNIFVSHQAKIWRSLIDNNLTEPSLTAITFWEAQSVESLVNAVLLENVTSNIASGATPAGTLFNIGMSFTEYVKLKEITTYYPILTSPIFSIANDQVSLLKIASVVNVGLTFNFNKGGIVLQGVFQNFRAGAATTFNLNGIVQAGNVLTVLNHAVTRGINNFLGLVNYGIGSQPKDSNNADFNTPLAAGTSATQTTSFEGVYPLFGSTVSITVATEQALVSMITGNNIQVNLVAESGGNKQFFEIPDAWLTARPLVQINYFNTVSNQFDTANKLTDFTITSVNKTIQGVLTGYKKYTYNGSDRANVLIRLIF